MLLDGVGEGRGKMRETDKRETDGWGGVERENTQALERREIEGGK